MHKRTTLRDGGRLRVADIEMAQVQEEEQEASARKPIGLGDLLSSPRKLGDDEVLFGEMAEVKKDLEIIKATMKELLKDRQKNNDITRGPMDTQELEVQSQDPGALCS